MTPTNLIERAVYTGRLDQALGMIQRALGITPDEFTSTILDAVEFKRAPTALKFQMLGDYLRTECFAAAERADRLVPMPAPLASYLASGSTRD